MKLIETLIIAVAALSGCKKNDMQQNFRTIDPTVATTPLTADTVLADTTTYLALGDSYTIGEDVPTTDSYPYQLAAQLKASKFKIGTPQVIARTGWTTGDLITAASPAALNPKYSFVTLLIGVNNQYQNYNSEAYRTDFDNLVNTAISHAKGGKKNVYVLSIPDYSVTPFAQNSDKQLISSELSTYNAINEGESSRLGVNYINITQISLLAKDDLTLLASDGLHPSGKMYALWVQQLLPKVLVGLK